VGPGPTGRARPTGTWRGAAAWAAHLGTLAIIAGADYATGADIQLSAIYLLPIVSAAYFWGRTLSVTIAVLAAASWYFNTDLIRPASTSVAILAWNGISRLAIYVVLALVVDQLRRQHAEVARLASTDDLTGLANARRFQAELRAELARAARYGRELALLLIDCDDLKRMNDEHGHTDGSRVLREIARVLAQTIRAPDVAARWGGDEFAVLEPEGTLDGALAVAERIRRAVHALSLTSSSGQPITITVSIGIAIYPTMGPTEESLFAAADRGLYAAKRGGKDRALAAAGQVTAPRAPSPPQGS
jgi:diguanylate cyclase (GGDEF)-like protein